MDVREKLVELLDIIIQPSQKTLGYFAAFLILEIVRGLDDDD